VRAGVKAVIKFGFHRKGGISFRLRFSGLCGVVLWWVTNVLEVTAVKASKLAFGKFLDYLTIASQKGLCSMEFS